MAKPKAEQPTEVLPVPEDRDYGSILTEILRGGFLDKVRLASVISVIGAIGALYCLIDGQINFQEFGIGLGSLTAGAGLLGQARNAAKQGLHDK